MIFMNDKITMYETDYFLHNAKIKSTRLGFEDHGIMTFFLDIEYSKCSGQGVGGYSLCEPYKINDKIHRYGTANGMDLIMRILNVVGVQSWEDLPGKYIRVYSNNTDVGAIFNILDDRGLWFRSHFISNNSDQS